MVISDEQVSTVGFLVEVMLKVLHPTFKVVAGFHDVTGEVFVAAPFAAVSFLETIERVVQLHVDIDCLDRVLFAHLRIFGDGVEVLAAHEALVVEVYKDEGVDGFKRASPLRHHSGRRS